MSGIRLEHITKKYDETEVLRNISMEVAEGELMSLVGPSGSGKTTILRLLAGLLEPTEGSIFIDGKNVRSMSDKERGTVIVFQDYALFPHMTVEQNIGFGLKVRGVGRQERVQKVKTLVGLLKMEGFEGRYPRELSGGQKQRVAIARALATQPNVLLLDEPFSSLDTHLRHAMRSMISDIQRKLGITTILVTHDTEEALMVSDRVAVLLEGEVAQYGTPRQVYRRPASRSIADFFGDNNTLDCVVRRGQAQMPFGTVSLESAFSGDAQALFRQESISMLKEGESAWSATVIGSTYTGNMLIYDLETDQGILRTTQNANSIWNCGERISIHVPQSEILFYRKDTGALI